MNLINKSLLGCVLVLSLIGCQDKAAMEAETKAQARKAKLQGIMSFCKNTAIYGEQRGLSENIILSEAEALGFYVDYFSTDIFKGAYSQGKLAIVSQNFSDFQTSLSGGSSLPANPTGVYVETCVEHLKKHSHSLFMS